MYNRPESLPYRMYRYMYCIDTTVVPIPCTCTGILYRVRFGTLFQKLRLSIPQVPFLHGHISSPATTSKFWTPFGAHTLPHYRAVQQSPGELVDTRSVRRSAVESETQTSHRRTCDSLLCGVSSSLISIAQCPMGLCCLCTRLHACGTGWLHCLRDKVALRRSPDSTASKLTASRQI